MSSNTEFGNISFDLPKNQSNVIKVIGVGGGGSNAINHMFQQGIKGVDFVICNTDSQALQNSTVPNKIQLGVSLTEGLGAGANPEVGEKAALESIEEISTMLDTNTKMVFITAGMGGGTGTGAAPVIAKLAKDKDILTVGIVTIPFNFEGKMRNTQARIGVEKLRSHVDSLIVINNDKLREVYGNLGFKAGFSKADEVLSTASRGIAEVITHHYTQNIDLRDAKTVLSNSGTAIMGSANASGANRASEAIMKALDSPLLNDNKIAGAKNVLLLIVSGSEEITIDEIGEINDHIQTEAGGVANIIMGVGEDETLEDAVSVTIIATGFDTDQQDEIVNTESKKIIHTLEDEQRAVQDLTPKTTAVVTPNILQQPVEDVTPKKAEVIRHTLVDDTATLNLIPTTELIKNMSVIYEEVAAPIAEDDFIITSMTDEIRAIEVNDPEFVTAATKEAEEEENQIAFTFDMPLANPVAEETPVKEENIIKFELTSEDVNAMEVTDHVEVIPVTEVHDKGVTRYSLDDYMDEDSAKEKNIPKAAEDGIVFEKKTIEDSDKKEDAVDEGNPFNATIEESLKSRVDERRRKLKEFNYKFNNNVNRIEEIEKQPAYKRAGIELDETNTADNASRTSLGTDSNDDMQLRSNNSFLHDNVD
ncbi:cell division protein FtsZ [Kordia sp. YSTF-M3]|uniref:Cell division protein FtsZ n=1 Tax=Kordia aestuariivivens TaxID=2759037 RepID=A0ABR7Q4Q1_9FLAO|nr:cell division protein FtsZ [Kordia aestuariivivens]MBC8753334.1 cell division protein FtsZ [Kordia aestuariivivens]